MAPKGLDSSSSPVLPPTAPQLVSQAQASAIPLRMLPLANVLISWHLQCGGGSTVAEAAASPVVFPRHFRGTLTLSHSAISAALHNPFMLSKLVLCGRLLDIFQALL